MTAERTVGETPSVGVSGPLGSSAPTEHVPERTASVLRARIAEGDLAPGAKLTEARLTAEFGVSRHSLRAAFQLLAAEGLVDRRPHRGVVVHSPTGEDVREIYRTRRVLELGTVSVTDYDEGALAQLDDIVESARRAARIGDAPEMAQANQDFHRRITAEAHSAVVTRAMEEMLARMRLLFHTMRDISTFHVDYVEPNARTVELLRAGHRPAVVEHMSAYFDGAERRLLDHLEDRGR
ncbi:GntR family transcriptional regulator [Nesterenkonia marinintestina]|uniref:GntR family transcriptional regulator n=1 Tax=Nesterenkonia marinintestina TaxID=2979865 RepID=UPI0021C12AE8|nr:GntR family transcriptional regulator [Nesterenkonia sp. GX14115]